MRKGEALFPRIDVKKELEALSDNEPAAAKPEPKSEKKEKQDKKGHSAPEYPAEIAVDDFFKVKLQVVVRR